MRLGQRPLAGGAETDMNANILFIGTPIWLGDKSSICTRVIERLYG